jgi:type IV pilus assembly protein PilY1
VMNFRGAAQDGPALLATNTIVAPFDSPITGVPVPYPSRAGQVADRVYVGDADGTLWRVNLTGLDPQSWTVELAWDAYALPSDAPLDGEPIQTPPVLSMDPVGDTVILFSTGDQESLASSARKTRLWSITEKAVGDDFIRSENWLIPFSGGARVTGPISLFDSVAYFATYTPSAAPLAPATPGAPITACSYGHSAIWGVHYQNTWQLDATPDPKVLPPESGQGPSFPQAKYAINPSDPAQGVIYTKDLPPGTTVFGVAVIQTPPCYEEGQEISPIDGPIWPFQKAARGATRALPGDFQLVYQTGKTGTSSEGAVTKTVTESLPAPRALLKVDSWASILE